MDSMVISKLLPWALWTWTHDDSVSKETGSAAGNKYSSCVHTCLDRATQVEVHKLQGCTKFSPQCQL